MSCEIALKQSDSREREGTLGEMHQLTCPVLTAENKFRGTDALPLQQDMSSLFCFHRIVIYFREVGKKHTFELRMKNGVQKLGCLVI